MGFSTKIYLQETLSAQKKQTQVSLSSIWIHFVFFEKKYVLNKNKVRWMLWHEHKFDGIT